MSDRSPGALTWEEAIQWLRASPDCGQLVRDAYCDDPLAEAADRYWRSDEWSAIRPLLGARSGEALDLGAGRGIASYALARDGFRVTAVEPDPSALVGAGAVRALAADQHLSIDVVQEVGEDLPFDSNRFDVAFGRAVLHHTKDLRAACREIFRVLRPGGRLVAVREHVISRPEDLAVFLASHPLHHLYGGENALMLKDYLGALRGAGMRVDRVLAPFDSPINYFPRTREGLRGEVASRARGLPGAPALVRTALGLPLVMGAFLRLVSVLSRRPGRLYSFVCVKPA